MTRGKELGSATLNDRYETIQLFFSETGAIQQSTLTQSPTESVELSTSKNNLENSGEHDSIKQTSLNVESNPNVYEFVVVLSMSEGFSNTKSEKSDPIENILMNNNLLELISAGEDSPTEYEHIDSPGNISVDNLLVEIIPSTGNWSLTFDGAESTENILSETLLDHLNSPEGDPSSKYDKSESINRFNKLNKLTETLRSVNGCWEVPGQKIGQRIWHCVGNILQTIYMTLTIS